jgi:hypothetical protein
LTCSFVARKTGPRLFDAFVLVLTVGVVEGALVCPAAATVESESVAASAAVSTLFISFS